MLDHFILGYVCFVSTFLMMAIIEPGLFFLTSWNGSCKWSNMMVVCVAQVKAVMWLTTSGKDVHEAQHPNSTWTARQLW